MAILQFSKFAPGGNDTVFLHCPPPLNAPAKGAYALAMIGGEQAGFVDMESKTLYMAGGEFCVNATRAFGALLDLSGQDHSPLAIRRHIVRVSGWADPVILSARGKMPLWQIGARLRLPPCDIEVIDKKHTLVRLPGITHLIYEDDEDNEDDNADETRADHASYIRIGESKRALFGLQDEAALGIIARRTIIPGRIYSIIPYVVVPGVGTAMIESCCGSASLALGLALFRAGITGPLKIGQPKSALEVKLEHDDTIVANIDGPVAFLLRGIMNDDPRDLQFAE